MPATHDYTVRGWGHDYTFTPIDGGMKGRMGGWGRGIKRGDYLLLESDVPGRSTRYKVSTIRYMRDPPDQWFADVEFAPRDFS